MRERQIPYDELYDVRLRERHLKKGALKQDELDKWLEALPDSAAIAATIDAVAREERRQKPND